jgi:hypothetical protein
MDKIFLEEQKKAIEQAIGQLPEAEVQQKKDLSVIYNFVCSLFDPEKFTDIQREDLRKLALELGYTEDTVFRNWKSKKV